MSDKPDDIKAAEKHGYAKGYQAGRRRVERDDMRAEIAAKREDFRRQAFLAALNGTLIARSWAHGGEPWKSPADYARGCWSIADAALGGTWFR